MKNIRKNIKFDLIHQIMNILSIMTFFALFTCTTGDRNNPVDPGNPNHVDPPVVKLSVKDTTIFVKDTLLLTDTCVHETPIDHYEWKIGSVLEANKTVIEKKAWNDSGKFIISLCAIDKYNQKSNEISCSVNVRLGQPSVTVESSKDWYINDTFSLTATGNDINGRIAAYNWFIGTKELGKGDSIYKNVFTISDTGKKVISIQVMDDDSIRSVVDTCVVNVKDGRPTVKFDFSEKTSTVRDSILIKPIHHDENGNVNRYIWQYTSGDSTIIDTADTIAKFFKWPDSGLKTISLQVVDDDNLVSFPAICKIKVGLGPKPQVSIVSSLSGFIKDTITLPATGTDSNGTVVKYIWQIDSIRKDTTVSGTLKISWQNSGKKNVIVQAVDNDGQNSIADTCLVTVSAGTPDITPINDTIISTTNAEGCLINFKACDHDLSTNGLKLLLTCSEQISIENKSALTRLFKYQADERVQIIWRVQDIDTQFSKLDTFFISFNRPPDTSKLKLSLPASDTARWNTIMSTGKGSVFFQWDGSDPDSSTDIRSFRFTLNTDSGVKLFDSTGLFKSCTVSNLDTLKKYNWRLVAHDRFLDSAVATGSFTTSFGLPVITSQPKNDTISKGDTLKLNISVAGKGTLTYQWKKNGVDATSENPSDFQKTGAAYSDSGYYKCIVTNSSGSVTSDSVKVVVLPAKPKIATQPVPVIVQQRNSAYFSVSAEGEFLQYQWQKNGVSITTNGNKDTLKIENSSLADSGAQFSCIVSNAGGSVTSNTVVLSVNFAPPVIDAEPLPVKVSIGQTARFRIHATGDNMVYQWQKNSVDIPGKTFDSLLVNPSLLIDSGIYRCIVKNNAGVIASDSVRLTVCNVYFKNETITFKDSLDIDSDGFFSKFYAYWDPDVSDSGSANVNLRLNYKLNSASSYSSFWNPANPVVINGTTTGYFNNIGSHSHGEYDYQLILFSESIPVDTIYATGHKEELNSEDEIAPQITLNPSGLTRDVGQSATFSVSATGSNLQYQWQKNGSNISGANSSIYTISSVTTSDNGNYTCNVSNSTGSVPSTSATLTVTPSIAPPQITMQPVNKIIDEGKNAVFSITASGGGTLQYQWLKNGNSISGATSSSYTIQETKMADSGDVFRCIVANSSGNDTSNAATLIVNFRGLNDLRYVTFTLINLDWEAELDLQWDIGEATVNLVNLPNEKIYLDLEEELDGSILKYKGYNQDTGDYVGTFKAKKNSIGNWRFYSYCNSDDCATDFSEE